jgi:hypothetical protein
MGKKLVLVIILGLGAAAAAHAQQTTKPAPYSGLGTGTAGAGGTAGTTSKTPGAEPLQTVPGGAIPMGASTQDASKLPDDPTNFDAGRRSKGR